MTLLKNIIRGSVTILGFVAISNFAAAQITRLDISGTVSAIDVGASYFGESVKVGSPFTETFYFASNPANSTFFGTVRYSYFPNNYSDVKLGTYPEGIDPSAGVAVWSGTATPDVALLTYARTALPNIQLYSIMEFEAYGSLTGFDPTNFISFLQSGLLPKDTAAFQIMDYTGGGSGVILGSVEGVITRYSVNGTPVPEASTFGVIGAFLLLTLAAFRSRGFAHFRKRQR